MMTERKVYTAEFKREAVGLSEQAGGQRGSNSSGVGRI